MNADEEQEYFAIAEKLLAEQNFTAAVFAGAIAMLLSAAAYGITVAKWSFTYGFAAAAIGIVVGFSMLFLGRGIATKFAWMAAAYAFSGCVLGSWCKEVMARALRSRSSPLDVLRNDAFADISGRAAANFALIEIVYWLVAIFFAVFLARRSLSRRERLALGLLEMKS